MFDSLYQMDNTSLFLWVGGAVLIISLICMFIVKYTIPLSFRYQDNAGLGTTASLVSLIYGVLAGLSALYLINNNGYISDAVQREANALANIHRYSHWLDESTRKELQFQIRNYIVKVVEVEWPLMKKGGYVNEVEGNSIIDKMTGELIHYGDKTTIKQSEYLMIQDLLTQVRQLYDARGERIQMSYTGLNPAIWVVVVLGTILTLMINFLFGMKFSLHLAMVGATALMTSSVIFLLISLDKPFQGNYVIEPHVFRAILSYMDHHASDAKPTISR